MDTVQNIDKTSTSGQILSTFGFRDVVTTDLKPGDVLHEVGRDPETVVKVEIDPLPCVVATIHTEKGWFWCGIEAIHTVAAYVERARVALSKWQINLANPEHREALERCVRGEVVTDIESILDDVENS